MSLPPYLQAQVDRMRRELIFEYLRWMEYLERRLQQRPLPKSAGRTIKFRRQVPFQIKK